ncbi:MAG: anhydro-N-acetylmuramic acid kinase, partial [Proteobacteria bacterium]|nr:anhydro-N-acetylmuramic acid kinase [Pseudomonadota bacterium]
TWQIGQASLLIKHLKIPIVYDFRKEDVSQGGQGAPLVPVFHQAIAQHLQKPCVFINIGGVSNLSYMDLRAPLIAGDCGPGCALINDYVQKTFQIPFDDKGRLAYLGDVHYDFLNQWLLHPYFQKTFPKSLDRNTFSHFLQDVTTLSRYNALSTLSALTAQAIILSFNLLPQDLKSLYLMGGGAKNDFIVQWIQNKISCPVQSIEKLGLDSSFIEAQAFAFLAVRSLYGLSFTYPTTTGVKIPLSGGKILND